MCVWYQMHVCVFKYLSQSFSTLFFEQGLSLNLELINAVELAGQKASGVLLSELLSTGTIGTHMGTHLAFHMGTGDLNSGPCACVARITLTESSSGPWFHSDEPPSTGHL